ncbi:MAG: preprotein translocase subunit SecG [Bacteriovoracia bacterium]
MNTLITVVHITTCFLLILVVLIQSGKGAEISASFAGSSQTIFGSSGGANFFTKLTGTLAGIFMLTSLVLTIMGSPRTLMRAEPSAATPPTQTAPAQTTPGAATTANPAAPAQAPAEPAKK